MDKKTLKIIKNKIEGMKEEADNQYYIDALCDVLDMLDDLIY